MEMTNHQYGVENRTWDCLQWPEVGTGGIDHLPLRYLELQFLVIFVLTQALHLAFFKRLGLPPLVSQLFAGLLLGYAASYEEGSSGYRKIYDFIFPKESTWKWVSSFGYALSLFIIAVKMDFTIIFRTGRMAYIIGILSLIIPLLINMGVVFVFHKDFLTNLNDEGEVGEILVNVTTIPLTHFPVVACLLSDLNLLNSELGRFALSSSLIANILSICLTSALKIYLTKEKDVQTWQILGPVGLVLAGVLVFRPLMHWMIKKTPKGWPVSDSYVLIVFLLACLGALVTDKSRQLVLLGFFIMGVIIPDGPPLGSALVDKFDSFISGMLLPFFVTSSVMSADMSKIHTGVVDIWEEHIILAVLAFFSKVIVCLSAASFCDMAVVDALALGLIMAAKGIVDIGSIIIFKQTKALGMSGFATLMLWIVLVATLVPVIVKHLYDPLRKYAGYQRRDIMHSRQKGELRILACIYRPDNVAALTHLLNICCPTKETPISTYVLHLMKLVGRSQPVFISHDLQQKKSLTCSYSEDVLWAFDRFERNNKDVISVHAYSAISLLKSMHEDICTLALDKLCSLIILPFHRRLRLDGSIDSEDRELRALNKSVLDRAPCSVGVLIDRGHFVESTPKNSVTSISIASTTSLVSVAVIFIGGHDDLEALAFAKRMAWGFRIKVNVLRLTSLLEKCNQDSIESYLLRDLQNSGLHNQQFTYMEKPVKDGAESAIFLKSVMGQYDLIIVGRRYHLECDQVAGLREWCEVEELGILGDLLASPDLRCRTSVLVVQCQRQWKSRGSC